MFAPHQILISAGAIARTMNRTAYHASMIFGIHVLALAGWRILKAIIVFAASLSSNRE
jgi:hypothetical protein